MFIALHFGHVVMFGPYFILNMWMIKRDVLSVELLKSKDKVRYKRIVHLSFSAKIYLLFGTPVLWKALILPARNYIPLNGLEYEHEKMSQPDSLEDLMAMNFYTWQD